MTARSLLPAAFLLVATLAAAADPPSRPIERAVAGQWILEKHSKAISAVTTATSYEVTWVDHVAERKIHLKHQAVTADRLKGLAPAVASLVDLDTSAAIAPWDEGKSVLVSDEAVTIGERVLRCKRTEVVRIDPPHQKVTTITWTSNETPLFGIVKTVTRDADDRELERTELVAWGETGCSELSVSDKP